MKKGIILSLLFGCILTTIRCKESNVIETSIIPNDSIPKDKNASVVEATKSNFKMNTAEFIPKNYTLYEEILGDLNNDGLDDSVLLLKGTDKEKILLDENSVNVNRNRRGIIILFKKGKGYELLLKNYECFSSESEEGSAYFDPELTLSIKKGNFEITFSHGKHGFWTYTFQNKKDDFELLKYYVSTSHGNDVIKSETTIDYSNQNKTIKTNTNKKAKIGKEVFKVNVEDIVIKKIVKLSEIKDFDELNILEYID